MLQIFSQALRIAVTITAVAAFITIITQVSTELQNGIASYYWTPWLVGTALCMTLFIRIGPDDGMYYFFLPIILAVGMGVYKLFTTGLHIHTTWVLSVILLIALHFVKEYIKRRLKIFP